MIRHSNKDLLSESYFGLGRGHPCNMFPKPSALNSHLNLKTEEQAHSSER